MHSVQLPGVGVSKEKVTGHGTLTCMTGCCDQGRRNSTHPVPVGNLRAFGTLHPDYTRLLGPTCMGYGHAEVALAELKGALFGLRLPGMGLTPQEALKDVEYYLEEVQDDWRRVWAWLHGRTSLQQLHPGYPVHEVRGLITRTLYHSILHHFGGAAVPVVSA